MPIIPSFSINVIPPVNPAEIDLVDASTGSDGTIATRQVLFYKIDNSLLVGAQNWPYSQSSISLTPLTQDIALNTIVNWLDGSNNILYTSAQIFGFKNYAEQFYYSLIQAMTANPLIVNDNNFFTNFELLRSYLSSVVQAINTGIDIYAAQNLIGKATNMVQQHQLFFNV